MPLNLQAKLLRTLQEGTILPLGGNSPVKIDVRVIASINKNPAEIIKSGEMRDELFYRLNVINIKIPPLRERPDDIPVLIDYFIKKYNKSLGRNVKGIDNDVRELFMSYKWPGNVRELEHVIEAAMNMVDGKIIKLEHLPVYLGENTAVDTKISPIENIIPLKEALEQLEKKMISFALSKARGNVSEASRLLRIPRTTLQYKMEKYKIND
jgi:arginine utilization regulatory protein